MLSMHQFQSVPSYRVVMAEGRVELFIETLTGTAFELSCSPLETIISIKAKIQCLEGIPVSQQHLIWRSQELLNDCCLQDYSISDGTTLKLVLGMRGGPINTSQAPADNKRLRDIADLVQPNSASDGSTGRPYTVLVFQDGDEVRMYRLLKTEDCSVSPSGTISKTSTLSTSKNIEESVTENKELLKENELTREKMAKLQEHIKSLSLNKPKRKESEGDGKGPMTKSVLRKEILGQSLRLPPVHTSSVLDNRLKTSRKNHDGWDFSVKEKLSAQNDPNFSCFVPSAGIEATALPETYQHKKLVNISMQKNSVSFLDDKNTSGLKTESAHASNVSEFEQNSISSHLLTSLEKESVMSDNSANPKILKECRVASENNMTDNEENILPNLTSSQQLGYSVSENSFLNVPCQNTESVSLNENSHYSIVKHETEKSRSRSKCLSITSTKELSAQRFLSLDKWVDERPKTTPQFNLYKPLDRIIEGGTWVSDGSIHGKQANKKERFSSKKKLSINLPTSKKVTPLSRPLSYGQRTYWNFSTFTSQDKADSLCEYSKSGTGSSVPTKVTVMKLHKALDAPEDANNPQVNLCNKIGKKSDRSGRKLNSAQKLPPIKTKKKCYKRCSCCNKKTGLATSYTCRCSKNFCATHRYAELHNCSYDYKSEGRRLLQLSNPVVVAPKLPKI